MRLPRYLAGGGLSLVTLALAVIGSWSLSGWLALTIAMLAAAALLTSSCRTRQILASIAGTLLLTLLVTRLSGAAGERARMLTLPSGASSRWAGRLIEEQDVSLIGARILRLTWRLPRDEQARLVPALHDAYVEMRRELGMTPSPVLDTVLARQSPNGFDAVVIEPPGAARPRAAVVFLHGYAGSFTLECWLIARAASAIGALTVCPASDFSGHWSGTEGEQLFHGTVDYLRGRGIGRIYLAGLSNGAIGASALARRFAGSLAGLILISGAPSAGGSSGLPTLVVQGERDTMVSAATARAFARHAGATYAGFDGGHFVLLIRRDEVRDTMARWLRESTINGIGAH